MKGIPLSIQRPDLLKEWNISKNGELLPSDVYAGSKKKVWWICDRGHEWEAIISNRVKGAGCPYCSGRYCTKENSLGIKCPELLQSWDNSKNGNLSPYSVSSKSNKKVWWICKNGHSWNSTIASRSLGAGCPYCSGRKVGQGNSLLEINADLAQQWDYNKNKDITPNDVTSSSNKEIWWRCERGHSWKATVAHRSKGRGCPQCYEQRGTKKMYDYLMKKNVSFQIECKIGLENNKPYIFDIGILDAEYNGKIIGCIEYHGPTHSNNYSYLGGEDYLKYIQKQDNLKEKICKELNIPLCIITFEERNQMNKILKDFLKKISSKEDNINILCSDYNKKMNLLKDKLDIEDSYNTKGTSDYSQREILGNYDYS